MATDVQAPVSKSFVLTVRNVGEQQETIQTGISDNSANTVFDYSSTDYSVEPDGERSVTVTLTGDPLALPHTAVFWAQVEGHTDTRQELTLSIDSIGTILIDYPTSRDTLLQGTEATITWSHTGYPLGRVNIEYYTDGGLGRPGWHTIVDSLRSLNDSYTWTVPFTFGQPIDLRITDTDYPSLRSTTVTGIVVRGAVGVAGGSTARPLDWVSLRSVGGELRAMFGDPAIERIEVYSPSGQRVAAGRVVDGMTRVGLGSALPSSVLVVRWVSGDGARHHQRVVVRK
ncbi:MAG: hypothetical protein GF331_19475 [Chitinivibrionales bacterium]|nr:hypothetical protein [Chitinivibrionales bacterium]